MKTQFSTVFERGTDGEDVAAAAAERALEALGTDRVDFWLVTASNHFDLHAVFSGVESVVGTTAQSLGATSLLPFSDGGAPPLDPMALLDPTGEGCLSLAVCASDTFTIHTAVADGLDDDMLTVIRDVVSDLPDGERPYQALMQLFDGHYEKPEELTLRLHQRFDPTVQVAGCGTFGNPLVGWDGVAAGANGEVVENGMAIGLVDSDEPLNLDISHGHEPMDGPYTVTSADESTIYELDGRVAFDVWQETIEEDAQETFGATFDPDAPVDPAQAAILSTYPFGIDTGEDYKCLITHDEDPTDEGGMRPTLEFDEGSELWIMKTTPTRQETSIQDVGQRIRDVGQEYAGVWVTDCGCRYLLLQESYGDALETLGDELDVPFVGGMAHGQTCMYPGDLTGYNHSVTVGIAFPK